MTQFTWTVEVGTLRAGDPFVTLLTRRSGIVEERTLERVLAVIDGKRKELHPSVKVKVWGVQGEMFQ